MTMAGIVTKKILFDKGKNYALYRPDYPQHLYNLVFDYTKKSRSEFERALDIGCGTGQVTSKLCTTFKNVVGTDISEKQLEAAYKADNIEYIICPAEEIKQPSNSVDLITVAQALHWFKLDQFYKEVKRVLKPNGVLAVWVYGLVEVENKTANEVIKKLHWETVGDYWDFDRKWLCDLYPNYNMPLKDFEKHFLSINKSMTLADFVHYVDTWSALKVYREKNPDSEDPLIQFEKDLLIAYNSTPDKVLDLNFPVGLFLGRNS